MSPVLFAYAAIMRTPRMNTGAESQHTPYHSCLKASSIGYSTYRNLICRHMLASGTQGDPVRLRTFFEAFNETFQHWQPEGEGLVQHQAILSDSLSDSLGSGSCQPRRSSIDGRAANHPVAVPVKGCMRGHPREVMEALVSALNCIPTDFVQGGIPYTLDGRHSTQRLGNAPKSLQLARVSICLDLGY